MKQTFYRRHPSGYFYKMKDTGQKKPYVRKNCKACGKSAMMQTRATAQFCSRSCSKTGSSKGYDYSHGYPRALKVCPVCQEEKWILTNAVTCSSECGRLRGEEHPNWNPDSDYKKYSLTQINGFHTRVRRIRGSAFGCTHCGKQEDRMYHWANVSRNYTDVNDYISLCVPCHYKYDAPKRAAARAAAESQD